MGNMLLFPCPRKFCPHFFVKQTSNSSFSMLIEVHCSFSPQVLSLSCFKHQIKHFVFSSLVSYFQESTCRSYWLCIDTKSRSEFMMCRHHHPPYWKFSSSSYYWPLVMQPKNLPGVPFGNEILVQVFHMQQDRWWTILDQKETQTCFMFR